MLGYWKTTYNINNGGCAEWANKVFDMLKDTHHLVEIWATLHDFADTYHVFLRIDGKFYDAECLNGCEDHMELPIFAKGFKKLNRRQPVWLEDINQCLDKIENRRDVTDEMIREYDEINGTCNSKI